MSMYICGGCGNLKDCDFVGCTEGADGELYCDSCVEERTDLFDEEGDYIPIDNGEERSNERDSN